ncbi:uncharacterized protein LOC108665140 [Hyalella azteca]|uniref:Uncharacterized protein LOC108665140 n=1 Tax=Hyalella azteca TaxID=294128 RepID=A0A8B7N1C9_HYAAZ|nr:uncharacterized protein LOC108665140 [Hyalella azteca]
MKSVGLVLLLAATFACSSVEGANECTTALYSKLRNAAFNSAFSACMSDPAGKAALTAIVGNYGCGGYTFTVGDRKCEVGAAPFMKCVAGKLGYLKADGSIDNTKILALYKTWATSDPKCKVAQYDSAVKKCGTTINNYAFLAKADCISTMADHPYLV